MSKKVYVEHPIIGQQYNEANNLFNIKVIRWFCTAHNKMAAVKKSISVTFLQYSLLKRKATGIFAYGRFLPR